MRRSTPHICLILGLAMTLGGCQEVPVAQSRRSAAISWDQLTILHGTAGGRTLLLGMPSRVLPREVTAQAAYRLRLSSSGTTPALAPVRGDPEVLDAVISPDGRRLAAVLVGGTLLLSALDTSPATQAATETAGREVHPGLAFSPNGRRLAFTCGDAPETDICLLDLPTGATRRMTRWHGPDDRPSFSADGRSVIFSSGRSGAAALWSVRLQLRRRR